MLKLTSISCVLAFIIVSQLSAAEPLKVGIYAQNINPTSLPVWVNGNIAGVQTDRIHDPLQARCLVLGHGTTKIAICIVDNCILPIDLLDRARALTAEKTGIPQNNVLIAATHTHSAVSVAGVHGTPIQEDYAEQLPARIAEGIQRASENMVEAQAGWGSVQAEKYIYCRRWLMKKGSLAATPFTGRDSDEVVMNPGHDNPNKLAPVGPIDRTIPILSIQTRTGKPLAVLASFSTHYAGSPALSADYFGVVANRLASGLRGDAPEQFLGIMANGTSGDANCIDFSKPREPFTHVDVGNYVAELILSEIPNIEHRPDLTLDAAFSSITVAARLPTDKEITEAQKYIDTHFPDRLPQTMVENYARETVLLSQLPKTRVLNCQALRIGDGVIVANPCESYGETGLKLREASPLKTTMNIGLANGHAGYIPPPAHFQLGGYTTWRARTSCLEPQAEPKMVAALSELMEILDQKASSSTKLISYPSPAQEPSQPTTTTRRQAPLAPSEGLKTFRLEPGWTIELAAAEPAIKDPVAMQMDTRGRLWVIEMTDYPNGPKAGETPLGRLVILDDKDNDLVYETSSVFADGLLFATGLQLWKDGALVTIAGKLVWLRDTNGDDKVDQQEPWLEGFQEQNPQLRANDPSIGWDARIYIANGLRGGMVGSANSTDRIPLANHDLRLHPTTHAIQLITGPAQFGLTWDQNGNRYFCSNRQPCREVVLEPHHSDLTTLPGFASATRDASPSETLSTVRPILNAWTTSNLHAGQFTAACGVSISHSSVFPGAHWGHVLTCEPTGSLVQRRTLERTNGHTSVKPFEYDVEWLASTDPWFRPVNLYEGPGGEIYVLDMHRAVIEHPEWVPEELKHRPDERLGDSAGRIYRVSTDATTVRTALTRIKSLTLHNASNETLISSLNSPSAWERSTAQRLLLERDSKQHVAQNKLLLDLLQQPASPQGKMLALGILSTRGKLVDETLEVALHDKSPQVRTAAWRLMADYSAPSTASLYLPEVIASLASTDRDELRAACWALARAPRSGDIGVEWIEQEFLPTLDKQFRQCLADPASLMAIGAASRATPIQWLQQICNGHLAQPLSIHSEPELLHNYLTASRAWAKLSTEADRMGSQTAILKLLNGKPIERLTLDERLCFYGLLYGYLQGGGDVELALKDTLRQQSAAMTQDESLPTEARSLCFQVLSLLSPSESKEIARQLLQTDSIALLQSALVRLQGEDDGELSSKIINLFASAPPQQRSIYFQAIRNNPKRMEQFVAALERGEYPASIVDTVQRQSLSSSLDKALWERLQKMFGAVISTDRESIIEKYRQAFANTADLENGKRMFVQHCSSCHKLDNAGTAIGPDISDARDQTFDKLLVSILDPNRVIDANYFRYVCQMTDGTIVDGLMEESSEDNVVLRLQNGNRVSIAREEIQDLKATGVSLMPVGFEAQLTPESMNDVIAYIKNWRYAPQQVPAQAVAPTPK
jgi:putative membrane-bound dehydrogenase-like protein